MSPLPDVLTVCATAGAVLGAGVAFAVRPKSDRELIENVVSGAQIGAVVGSAAGFVVWLSGTAAGA